MFAFGSVALHCDIVSADRSRTCLMKARPLIVLFALSLTLMFLGTGCGKSSSRAEVQKRLDLVRTASNPAYLEKAALEDESPVVRQAATERLFDQKLIERIVIHDKDFGVRLAALKRVRSQAVVGQVATGDKSRYVRIAAAGILNDQRILTEVARTDRDRIVRMTAIGGITSRAVIEQVADSDKDPQVRAAAEKRLASLR